MTSQDSHGTARVLCGNFANGCDGAEAVYSRIDLALKSYYDILGYFAMGVLWQDSAGTVRVTIMSLDTLPRNMPGLRYIPRVSRDFQSYYDIRGYYAKGNAGMEAVYPRTVPGLPE